MTDPLREKLDARSDGVTVLVLGAAGVVGYGASHAWLNDGATVIAVDRDEAALAGLADRLGLEGEARNRLVTVMGDLSSEEGGKAAKEAVAAALGCLGDGDGGASLTHVVTAVGCSSPTPSGTGVSSPDALRRLKSTYEDVFFPNLLATTLFLDDLRETENASFTVAGGPFTHHCPNTELYNVSMMGATLNHFGTVLAADTKDSRCRGNTLCCHHAIGYPPDLEGTTDDNASSSSSFGKMLDKDFGPVTDCREWGKAFVRVGKGSERSGFICMHDAEEVAVLVKSTVWQWFPEKGKFGPVY